MSIIITTLPKITAVYKGFIVNIPVQRFVHFHTIELIFVNNTVDVNTSLTCILCHFMSCNTLNSEICSPSYCPTHRPHNLS